MSPIHIHEYFIYLFTGSKILCGQKTKHFYWIKILMIGSPTLDISYCVAEICKHAKIMCLTGAVNVSENCNKLHVIRPRVGGRIFLIFRIKPTSLHNFVGNLCNLQRHSLLFFEIILKIRQSSIYYPGSLGCWDKWLIDQVSDVLIIILFFIISCKILCKNCFNLFFYFL